MERLADGRILTGEGGNLRAKQIEYVYLPPWGPGVQEVRTTVESNFTLKKREVNAAE